MGILDSLTALAPVLTAAAASRAKNQDTNTALGTSIAASRPGIVSKNLSNAKRADLMKNFTPPQLNWGGPGSVVKGQQATYTGGPGPQGQDVSDLESLVQQDALSQAKSNYGLSDPAASSGLDTTIGAAGTATGILGALSKLKLGGGPGSPSGPAGGPGSPGTFGKGSSGPSADLSPSAMGTPADLSNVDPNGFTAYGSDQIQQLLRLLGNSGGGFGSGREPGTDPGTNAGYI